MDTLPTEILIEIFRNLSVVDRPRVASRPQAGTLLNSPFGLHQYVSGPTTRNRIKEERTGRSPGWIRVTFVCRRWRECALQTSFLWTYLPDTADLGVIWFKRFVERGKQAGLYYDDEDFVHVYALAHRQNLLLEHIHHIGVLRLMGPPLIPTRHHDVYHEAFGRPTPLIRELSLRDLDLSDLQLELPSLRRLRLWNTTITPWPTRLFTPNITSFEFYAGPQKIDEQPIGIARTVATLREMPNLISLTLKLDAGEPPESEELQKVSLRALARLDLSGRAEYMHVVLEHLSFPPSTSVRIAPLASTPANDGADETSNLSFVSFYEDLVRNAGLPDFCTVEVFIRTHTVFFAGARHRLRDVSLAKPSYNLTLELPAPEAEEDVPHGLVANIINRLCKKDSIRELYVSGAWEWPSITTLYDMANVVHVDLMGPAITLLVQNMAARAKVRHSPGEKRLGDCVQTLAFHRGHLDIDPCRRWAELFGSDSFRSKYTLETIYLSKANLGLLGGVWNRAGVEVVGV